MSAEDLATVLVVDDEPGVADSYAAQLATDYRVKTAYSGTEALDALTPEVDVVLLDRRMPDMSGDDVLEEIRELDIDCRVAMVTAVDPDFDIIEMPFDDYIIKPAFREDLIQTTRRLLICSEYESKLKEYYALSAKYAALLASKSDAELEESEEFSDLAARRQQVRAELEATVDQFDTEDFAAVFRELHSGDSLAFEPTDSQG